MVWFGDSPLIDPATVCANHPTKPVRFEAIRKGDERSEQHQRPPGLAIGNNVLPTHDVREQHDRDNQERNGCGIDVGAGKNPKSDRYQGKHRNGVFTRRYWAHFLEFLSCPLGCFGALLQDRWVEHIDEHRKHEKERNARRRERQEPRQPGNLNVPRLPDEVDREQVGRERG
jgi:hypothetical protein